MVDNFLCRSSSIKREEKGVGGVESIEMSFITQRDIIQQKRYTSGKQKLLLTLRNQAVVERVSIRTSWAYEDVELEAPFKLRYEPTSEEDLKILNGSIQSVNTYVPDDPVNNPLSFHDFKKHFLDYHGFVEEVKQKEGLAY